MIGKVLLLGFIKVFFLFYFFIWLIILLINVKLSIWFFFVEAVIKVCLLLVFFIKVNL